jgi:hypothetical protein
MCPMDWHHTTADTKDTEDINNCVILAPCPAPPTLLLLWCSYITVDASAGRHLFYALVTSQGDPASDPLMLWLNG